MTALLRRLNSSKPDAIRRDALALAGLLAATLAVCWPLGLTNRILTGVDAFTYFLPYWAYRSAELRAGHLPLWNPYLFLGAPFLANPQAAVLYPLHWPLIWLEPARALIWSALLHIWLAAGCTYAFGRRSLRLSRAGAWTAALLFGMGGFALGKIENINQLNALAWLPATLWCFDEARDAIDRRSRLRWAIALSFVLALQILAGHTQTTFINLVGLGIYALVAAWKQPQREPIGRQLARLWPLLAVGPAVLLAAGQLLPGLELNGLGLRTGGLTYRLAASFSLRPRLLLQTFLPPFAGGLAEAFNSEGFTEFTGYVGLAGLILAALAFIFPLDAQRPARARATALVLVGIFLALGAYNPVYYLLWRFVPGFDLFRAPARWLALYAFGAAALAGLGLDLWLQHGAGRAIAAPARWGFGARRLRWAIAFLALAAFVVTQQPPPAATVLGWAAAAVGAAALLLIGLRRRAIAAIGLPCLILAELWLAGRSLPFALATAPAATGLRNAPAVLLAATADEPAAGRGRFLSMSDIRFDPGDLAELRRLQADRLPAEAVERFVRAAKWNEILAPNLALVWRLPALDGYDGGVLPTADYGRLQTLFVPEESRLPDGRLREQLRAIPPDRLLDLTGVRFVITDKQHDLWYDDVYYDLEQPVLLRPGQTLTLDLSTYPAFSATALGVIAVPETSDAADARGIIGVAAADGRRAELELTAAAEGGASGHAPLLRPRILPLPAAMIPATLTLAAATDAPAGLIVRGLSLLDTRTAGHQSVTLSPRGDLRRIHSGDVKIYERTAAPGRAWLVHQAIAERDPAATLAGLADANFDPRRAAFVAADLALSGPATLPDEAVRIVSYEAERVHLEADVRAPALLVLADSFYPGWRATVDGAAAPILRADLMFRAVALSPGRHTIVFSYEPSSWRWGAAISLATCTVLGAVLAITMRRPSGRTGV